MSASKIMQPNVVNPASHHRPGGGYRNPWPDTALSRFADFLRWRLVERRTHPIAPNPPRDSLPRRQPSIATPFNGSVRGG